MKSAGIFKALRAEREALFQLYWVKSLRIRNLVEFLFGSLELDGDGMYQRRR